MAQLNVRELGDYIRDQRKNAQISLRQLARLAGVSNPYLSQIERGLRRPSAEILQQIAKALRISAEALYVQAGILEQREDGSDVPAALLGDGVLTERQKQVLLEIYDSFRKENDVAGDAVTGDAILDASPAAGPPAARPPAAAVQVAAEPVEASPRRGRTRTATSRARRGTETPTTADAPAGALAPAAAPVVDPADIVDAPAPGSPQVTGADPFGADRTGTAG